MGEGACVPVGAGGLGGYTHQRVNQLVRGEAHDSRNRTHRQTHPGVAGGWTPLCRFDSCRRVFTGSRGKGGSRGVWIRTCFDELLNPVRGTDCTDARGVLEEELLLLGFLVLTKELAHLIEHAGERG